MSQYFLSKVNYGLRAKYLDWARVLRHICGSLWVSFCWVLMRDPAWGPSFCMMQTQRSINYELAQRAGELRARSEPQWYSVELAKRWKQKQRRQSDGRGAGRWKKREVGSSCVWVDVSERQSGSDSKVALGQVGVTLLLKHTESSGKKRPSWQDSILWYQQRAAASSWSFCRRCRSPSTNSALTSFNSKKHLVQRPITIKYDFFQSLVSFLKTEWTSLSSSLGIQPFVTSWRLSLHIMRQQDGSSFLLDAVWDLFPTCARYDKSPGFQ